MRGRFRKPAWRIDVHQNNFLPKGGKTLWWSRLEMSRKLLYQKKQLTLTTDRRGKKEWYENEKRNRQRLYWEKIAKNNSRGLLRRRQGRGTCSRSYGCRSPSEARESEEKAIKLGIQGPKTQTFGRLMPLEKKLTIGRREREDS